MIEYKRQNQNEEDTQSMESGDDADSAEYQYLDGQNKQEPMDEMQLYLQKREKENEAQLNAEFKEYRNQQNPNFNQAKAETAQGDWAG